MVSPDLPPLQEPLLVLHRRAPALTLPEDPGPEELAQYWTSLNLSYFVAHKIWRRRGVTPRRCRAHRLQRREPHRWLLVFIDTTFDLLQTAIN